ncbi:MAG: ABC transporter ATP-binding protein/permease [Christensenellaceae bacterium]|nr:ABC transporter ATP-binding protein/permease [Christensenellaceae bacterium]
MKNLHHNKGVKKYILLSVLALAAYEGLCLYFPILLQDVTKVAEREFASNNPSVTPLVLQGLLVFGFILVMFGGYYLSEWVGAICTNKYAGNVRASLYEKFSRLQPEQIDQIGIARILPTIMNDANWLKKYHRRIIVLLVYFPVAILGSFIMLFTLSWVYAMFAFASIPFVGVFTYICIRRFSKTIPASVDAYDEYFLNIKEGIKGAKDIRILGKAEERSQDFEEYVRLQRRQGIAFDRGVALSNAFHTILFTLITIAIIIYAAAFNLSPAQTNGVIILNTATQYINKVWEGSHQIFQWFLDVLPRTRFTVKRLDKFYIMPEAPRAGGLKEIPTYKTNVLKLKNVEFKYPNGKKPLNGVNIDIPDCKLVSIVGGVNSGKSMIASLIIKLKEPTGGNITFNDIDIAQINSNYWRRDFISYCDSSPKFVPGTIRDNMRFLAPQATDDDVIKIFKDIGATSIINQFDDFLGYEIKDGNLSEGHKNVLNIVRALLKPAHLYVFNQCFEHVSNAHVTRLMQKVKREKKTAIFFTYNGLVCKGCDTIYVLKDGRITATGTHSALLKDSKDYREFHASMLGVMIDGAEVKA